MRVCVCVWREREREKEVGGENAKSASGFATTNQQLRKSSDVTTPSLFFSLFYFAQQPPRHRFSLRGEFPNRITHTHTTLFSSREPASGVCTMQITYVVQRSRSMTNFCHHHENGARDGENKANGRQVFCCCCCQPRNGRERDDKIASFRSTPAG